MKTHSCQTARSRSLRGPIATLAITAMLAVASAMCSVAPAQAQATAAPDAQPSTSVAEPVAAPEASPVTAVATAGSASDYVLGASDKIRVTVYGEPSLTGEYFVSTSGTVNLPLAGDVQAAGLTLGAFRDKLVKALEDGYLKDPKISVEILTFRPFYILGEVVRPGQYPYTNGLTVFNAVATAGGFTYRANTRRVFIKKAKDTQEREYPLTSQTAISPGDTVRIPERFF